MLLGAKSLSLKTFGLKGSRPVFFYNATMTSYDAAVVTLRAARYSSMMSSRASVTDDLLAVFQLLSFQKSKASDIMRLAGVCGWYEEED